MRAFARPHVSTVVLVCAAQMGKTELVFNVIGWTLDDRPRPVIYVGPTKKLATTMMKDRIDYMLSSVDTLAERADRRRGYWTTLERYVAGVRLGVAWAGSNVELMAHSAATVLVDERDAMEDGVKNAGDPVLLAMARTKNWRNGKCGIFSTPTLEGESAIWSWWEAGSKHRWYLRCAECGDWFLPRSELLRWPEGADAEAARIHARLVCDACGVEYDDQARLTLEGRYFPHVKQGEAYVRVDTPVVSAIESYWVSGLVTPFTPLGEIAFKLRSAYAGGDPEALQTTLNAYLGELYKLEGDSPGWEGAWACRAPYDAQDGADQLITAGVDVQKDRLYVSVRGWRHPNATSRLLAHTELFGETAYDDVWVRLGTFLENTYGGQAIALTLVDSGYTPGARFTRPENVIYKHCRRLPRCLPSKGHDHLDRPHKLSRPDVRHSGKTQRRGLKLWHIDTGHYKAWLYGRIRHPVGEPGAWSLPETITEDYCKQVTNEQLIYLPSGRSRWQRTGTRENHYLDTEVLCAAAAHVCNVTTLKPPAPAGGRRKPRTGDEDPGLQRTPL